MKTKHYYLLALILTLILFTLDLVIPLGVAFGVLYFIIILIALQLPDNKAAIYAAIFTSVLIIIGLVFSPEGGEDWKVYFNRAISVVTIWLIALLGYFKKEANDKINILSRAMDACSSTVIITDIHGNIEYVNPKFSEITDYTSEEVIGKNPNILKSGQTQETEYTELWDEIKTGKTWKGIFHNKKKNGDFYWANSTITGVKDAAGDICHYIGMGEDITNEYELNDQLSFQASHDSLTGFINRFEFERRCERILSTFDQDDEEHSLCIMNLDRFKIVNDTCGHAAGDELLRQLSKILQHEVRKRDTLARLGGDEFGILMEHCSLDHAHRVATSIRNAVNDYQFIWENKNFKVGISIGLVTINSETHTLSNLLKEADTACYMSKENGRNRIHVYHAEDSEIAQHQGEMQWVARLYKAEKERRFCLYAQPIVPLDSSNDIHYELLIRMTGEDGKLIPPGAFLPAAERYNLITNIDNWVIDHTFNLLSENQEFLEQINYVSINISGHSLASLEFQRYVINKFMYLNIKPEKICFEITETAIISNLNIAKLFIKKMKAIGCQFALDDFGSGLSSFGYLKILDVDYLKIDGMFVKDIVDDPIDHAMIKSINEIGHVMGMKTIAEFVENDEIKGMLREIGVDYAQGYGIGKPMPFTDLINRSCNVSKINKSSA